MHDCPLLLVSHISLQSHLDGSMGTKPNNMGDAPDEESSGPRSSRMDEALRLRQAMKNSSSCLSRKQLINALQSPRHEADKNQFDDTESEGESDEDFAVASFKGLSKGFGENDEPNVGSIKGRGVVIGRLDIKGPTTPKSKASTGTSSLSSKAFQDQISARFRSTAGGPARMASADSNED